jgi:hypothetical protein
MLGQCVLNCPEIYSETVVPHGLQTYDVGHIRGRAPLETIPSPDVVGSYWPQVSNARNARLSRRFGRHGTCGPVSRSAAFKSAAFKSQYASLIFARPIQSFFFNNRRATLRLAQVRGCSRNIGDRRVRPSFRNVLAPSLIKFAIITSTSCFVRTQSPPQPSVTQHIFHFPGSPTDSHHRHSSIADVFASLFVKYFLMKNHNWFNRQSAHVK